MSQGMTTAAVTEFAPLPKTKQSHTTTLAQVDDQIRHLTDFVLPPYPYLLSVPSDVPYRHSSRFVNTWYENTPFGPQEEQLQYLSFLPHQGDHESLLKVEGGWADDRGEPIAEEEELSPTTLPASGRHTPAEIGARKKISLKDYKTKGKTSPDTSAPPRSFKSAELPVTAPVAIEEEKKDTPLVTEPKRQELQPVPIKVNGVKNSRPKVPDTDTLKSPKIEPKSHKMESPNPAKRRRLSPPFEEPQPTAKAIKPEPASSGTKMPRLLSPTLPSPEKEKEENKGLRMPQLLSPLLPPSLAKELSTPPSTASLGSPATTPLRRSDPVRSILAGADLDNGQTGDKSGLTPGNSRIRSNSQNSAKGSVSGTPNAAKTILGAKPLGKSGASASTPLHSGARASPGPRQRHTIILKYGKKNRKRVEALLKFAARPKKEPVKRDASEIRKVLDERQKKEASRKDAIEPLPSKEPKPGTAVIDEAKIEKKRKAEDSPSPSVKKIRPVEAEKRPTTPVPPAGKTLLSSQPKSTFSTPKKEYKSTAMRRVESTDGGDAPTPTGDKARVSTPQGAPKPSPQPPSGSTSGSRQDDRQQWISINEKFFALGRKLKHEGTDLLPRDNEGKSPKAVLMLIEALLCFMINIAAQSQTRPNVDPGWRSIILYHISVFRNSRKFPHLHALVVQLGAVCRQLVHKYDMDRLARDPLPEDYCNSAPTPGSDGNTKTTEDGEKYKKQYVEFQNELVSNARELQTAWLDSSRLLPLDLLKREYHATWSKRAKDASVRLQEKLVPTSIAKDFYLPFDANTTAFEAARFGVAFLEEWAEREKVDWKTRIDL